MNNVIEFINEDLPKNKLLSVKVTSNVDLLLREVYEWRKKQGYSKDYSTFIREALSVALLMGNPEEFLPKFLLPNMTELVNQMKSNKQTINE